MKLLNERFTFARSAQDEGRYVELPANIITSKRTELTERVRGWLRELDCPFICIEGDEGERLLEDINDTLPDTEEMRMAVNSDYDYFISFSENLIVHVVSVDEYNGRGSSETYVAIKGLVLNADIMQEEISEAVQWIKHFELKEPNVITSADLNDKAVNIVPDAPAEIEELQREDKLSDHEIERLIELLKMWKSDDLNWGETCELRELSYRFSDTAQVNFQNFSS